METPAEAPFSSGSCPLEHTQKMRTEKRKTAAAAAAALQAGLALLRGIASFTLSLRAPKRIARKTAPPPVPPVAARAPVTRSAAMLPITAAGERW